MPTEIDADRTYRGQRAVVLESPQLRVTLLPDWGSRLASIVVPSLERELLVQSDAAAFLPSKYADDYLAGECAGWDEMFPTVDACTYRWFPWEGIEAPDHGELWAIPWRMEAAAAEVSFDVSGVRFPYRVHKRVRLEANRLILDYSASNPCVFGLPFVWAAHPLFKAVRGMRIRLPDNLTSIINASSGSLLGEPGGRYAWPTAEAPEGEIDLSTMAPYNGREYHKYYFADRLVEGWAELHDPGADLSIRLDWPAKQAPYLGMWVNEGGVKGQYCIAPEPATGAMDTPVAAEDHAMGSVLPAGSRLDWQLALTVIVGAAEKSV